MLSCSARAVLHQSCDGLSRGPNNERSRRLAADLSTTIEAFENHQSYELHGRTMSSRFASEHGRQQASVMSRGRESTYATGLQLSMSRGASHPEDGGSAADTAHVPSTAAYRANAQVEHSIVRCDSQIETAAPIRSSNWHQGAQPHHSSTATLAYAPGNSKLPGHKRKHDQTVHADDVEPLSSLVQHGGYNTRAKNRKGPEK